MDTRYELRTYTCIGKTILIHLENDSNIVAQCIISINNFFLTQIYHNKIKKVNKYIYYFFGVILIEIKHNVFSIE